MDRYLLKNIVHYISIFTKLLSTGEETIVNYACKITGLYGWNCIPFIPTSNKKYRSFKVDVHLADQTLALVLLVFILL